MSRIDYLHTKYDLPKYDPKIDGEEERSQGSKQPFSNQSPAHPQDGDIEMIDTTRRNYQPKDSDEEEVQDSDACNIQDAKYLSSLKSDQGR